MNGPQVHRSPCSVVCSLAPISPLLGLGHHEEDVIIAQIDKEDARFRRKMEDLRREWESQIMRHRHEDDLEDFRHRASYNR